MTRLLGSSSGDIITRIHNLGRRDIACVWVTIFCKSFMWKGRAKGVLARTTGAVFCLALLSTLRKWKMKKINWHLVTENDDLMYAPLSPGPLCKFGPSQAGKKWSGQLWLTDGKKDGEGWHTLWFKRNGEREDIWNTKTFKANSQWYEQRESMKRT